MHNPRGIQGDNFKYCHEYCFFVIPSGHNILRPGLIPEDEWEYTPLRNWGGESNRSDGGVGTFYPVLVRRGSIVGVGQSADETYHPKAATIAAGDDTVKVWPIDSKGNEKKWRYARHSLLDVLNSLPERLRVDFVRNQPQIKIAKVSDDRKTVWTGPQYDAGTHGTRMLTDMLGVSSLFSFPKSLYQVAECIEAVSGESACILDYFAGSGTTAHAVINLNRQDQGRRKYILAEMGAYFDDVLKPRVLKAVYSRDWKQGKPVSREGLSQLIKVVRLESYEDTLNNLEVRRDDTQTLLIENNPGLREEYLLHYWMDLDTRGSASLLAADRFDDPWSYTLQVSCGSAAETRLVNVDLVETFNYLIGLRVTHVDRSQSIAFVRGLLPSGERTLVIWRKTADFDGPALDAFFWDQPINPRNMQFDIIYVNGDNQLSHSRRADEAWDVRLIENEFHRLMFESTV